MTSLRHWKIAFSQMRLGLVGGQALSDSGGSVLILKNGLPRRQALFNKDGSSLAQPLTFTGGVVEFYTASASTGHDIVDMVGITPGGRSFMMPGMQDGGPNLIQIDTTSRRQSLIVPASMVDCVANTEFDTGLQLPVGIIVSPFQTVNITVLEASKTLSWGELASPTGYGNAVPLDTAQLVALKSASTATRGSLIGAGTLDTGRVINAAIDVSVKFSSGATVAEGYIEIPYDLVKLS